MMEFIKNNLANAFTLANLFSGTIAVVQLLSGNHQAAAFCIAVSLILDFFDGFIARALQSDSLLGGQLDSLADMVSFGVVPGLAMYTLLEPFGAGVLGFSLPFELKYLGLFITVFSCLRLAIFNLDDQQTYSFRGLNTPSNTLLIFGLLYAFKADGHYRTLAENPGYLIMLTVLSSWLLVSPIKMIALKFKSMLLKDNYPKLVLLAGALVLLAFFGLSGIPLIIVFYIITSLLFQKQL